MTIYLLLIPLITLGINYILGTPLNSQTSPKKHLIITLLGTSLNYKFTIFLFLGYDYNLSFQYIYWASGVPIFGVDTISLWKILLVNIITAIVILHSYKEIASNLYNKYLQLIL